MDNKSDISLTEISTKSPKDLNEVKTNEANEDLLPENNSLTEDSEEEEIEVKLDFNYYEILRRVLLPFIFTGAPINHYLKGEDRTKFKWLSQSGIMKLYSFGIVILVHLLCGFWLARVLYNIFGFQTLTRQLWDEIFTFLYSFVGVVALDIMWIRRNSLRKLIFALDVTPTLDQTLLIHDKYFKIKFKLRLAFLTLFILALTVLCLTYIVIIILVALNTDSDTLWTDRIFSFIPLYSLYVVLFVMSLYIAFCWIMKFKFEHLNIYIETLRKRKQIPNINQLEIIKIWYRSNLNVVTKLDDIFNLFIFGYFALLFFGIVVQIEEVIAILESSDKTVQEVILSFVYIGLMLFALFYTIKETSGVYDQSTNTKNLLYAYVLSTKPEDRNDIYYEEFQLMIPGLLSSNASFTLLGLVNLNKDFMAHSVVFIYTYTLLFKQFASDANIQIKNITDILNKKS